jgi:hypothetical protein
MEAILIPLLNALLPTVVTLVTAVLGWFGTKLAKSMESKNQAEKAAATIGQFALGLAGDIWTSINPVIQGALADGSISAAERAAILKAVTDRLGQVDVSDTVSGLAKALGLPLSSVIGTITEWLIGHFAKAHDPDVPTASSLPYPVGASKVQASSSLPPKGVGVGG